MQQERLRGKSDVTKKPWLCTNVASFQVSGFWEGGE